MAGASLERAIEAVQNDEMVALCTGCDHEESPMEPDAELECPECGKTMYGAETYLIMMA